MPHGTHLSDYEVGQIHAYSSQGLTQRQISEKIGRSQKAVWHVLQQGDNYNSQNHQRGRKQVLSEREVRLARNLASSGQKSIREIQREIPTQVALGTVYNAVNSSEYLLWTKKDTQPLLTPRHKEARPDFAKSHQTWDKEWRKVIFSDEKKFNLDGPDSNSHYWHDLRKDKEIFSRRQQGGGSTMMWGAFGYYGKSELQSVPVRSNSSDYQAILQSGLLRDGSKMGGRGWIFQQDNAPIHTSASTRAWLTTKKVLQTGTRRGNFQRMGCYSTELPTGID